MTASFSAEMAGTDAQAMLDTDNLQEADGSVSHSPSATAYYLARVRPDDSAALMYLRSVVDADGGTPMAMPFEICERAWVLWNISYIDGLDSAVFDACKPHLDALKSAWKPLLGVGFTDGHSVSDGDDTSLTFDVLSRFGYKVDFETLLQFEERDHFRTYPLEITYSVSTNVHFLGALRQMGLKESHPLVEKVIQYLLRTRTMDSFWFDKWQTSPLYTTAHAIMTCSDFHRELVDNSVQWLLSRQNDNGSWGFYAESTSEETAYALQALSIWKRHGGKVERDILARGLAWLQDHESESRPHLWIAKSLNYSEWIIQAELLTAKMLVQEQIG